MPPDTFAGIPVHFGERQNFSCALTDIGRPGRTDLKRSGNVRSGIFVPPRPIAAREQVMFAADGAQGAAPRFLRTFTDQAKSRAAHPNEVADRHARLGCPSEA